MAEVIKKNYNKVLEVNSIPAESVQSLAEEYQNGRNEVPERYLRPEAEAEMVATPEDEEIPVIDILRLVDPSCAEEELAKLKYACEEWGFFQLINHGVPEDLLKQMKDDVVGFFKLPLEEKMKCAPVASNLEGYGQTFVFSEDQKLDWADKIYIRTRPICTRKMQFWPTNPPSLRDTLDRYSSEQKKVARILLSSIAINLGLDPEILLSNFKDQSQGVRMSYYPPCPKADKVLGISPHTDGSALTVLLQVNDVPGLQIRKDGKWFPVEPLDGAFVVNIGDILEILSNGKCRSIEHRVTINTKKERLSIGAFHGPDAECTVGPLPELVRGSKEVFRTISYAEFVKTVLSTKLDGRSLLESMKLE